MKKRLDVLLVERGLAETRSQAQALVIAGLVPGYDKPGTQLDESVALDVAVLDWRAGPPRGAGAIDLVVAADVLYEERNAAPLLALLDNGLAPGGEALVADPGRTHAEAFFEAARASGWSLQLIEARELAAGGITVLRRETQRRG